MYLKEGGLTFVTAVTIGREEAKKTFKSRYVFCERSHKVINAKATEKKQKGMEKKRCLCNS